MTELATIAAQVGVNERTLRRAVNLGTLRGARPTARTLRLSISERQYIRRSWELLSTLRKVLRTEQNVRFALLFGSTAIGTDTPESDVDLLVDLRNPALERVVDLSAKLAGNLGRPVEVVRLQEAESEPSFLAHVVAEGRVLIDRDGLWAPLRRREQSLRRHARSTDSRRAEAALGGIDLLVAGRDG